MDFLNLMRIYLLEYLNLSSPFFVLPYLNGMGFKYIHGEEMIAFAWECLNETKKIKTCSRRYDFGGGNELEYYVRFLKGKKDKVTIKDFEEYCNSIK